MSDEIAKYLVEVVAVVGGALVITTLMLAVNLIDLISDARVAIKLWLEKNGGQ